MVLKHVLGPTPCLTMEVRDPNGHTPLEGFDQLICWTKHFTQLYSTKVPFKDQALHFLDQMAMVDHLNSLSNVFAIILALRSIKLGKAPGSNGIPSEILKLGIYT